MRDWPCWIIHPGALSAMLMMGMLFGAANDNDPWAET